MFYACKTNKLVIETPTYDIDKIDSPTAIGYLENCPLGDEFNKLLSKQIDKFAKQYPWLNALGDLDDTGYLHAITYLSKLQDAEPIQESYLKPKVGKELYSFYLTKPVYDAAFRVLYCINSNMGVKLHFPGVSEDKEFVVEAGGLLIYPSTFAFTPLLLVDSNTANNEVEYMTTTLKSSTTAHQ